MRVKVRPMRRFGQLHRFKEIEAMPPHAGILEVRDLRLGRTDAHDRHRACRR